MDFSINYNVTINDNVTAADSYDSLLNMLDQYEGSCTVEIEIAFNKETEAGFDELLLIEPYLLALKFQKAKFNILILNESMEYTKKDYLYKKMGEHKGERKNNKELLDSEFYSIEVYTRAQRQRCKNVNLNYKNKAMTDEERVKENTQANKPRRLAPMITIDKEMYSFLEKTSGFTENIKPNGEFRTLHELCLTLLYGDINANAKYLSISLNKYRKLLFKQNNMKKYLSNMSMLARIIFSYFDYAYRLQAVEAYAKELKKGKRNLPQNGRENGVFLDEKHYLLDAEMIEAEKRTHDLGYDNSTFFAFEGNQLIEPHAFVVSAMLDACVIAEGLLQLIENVVRHAGDKKDNGLGILSLHLRIAESDHDEKLLWERYGKEYFSEKNCGVKLFFEIVISDASSTNIPNKFRANHANDGSNKIAGFKVLNLESFFNPLMRDDYFWKKFYSKPGNTVRHYGVEIFKSIVTETKGGLFICVSGKERFPSNSKLNIGALNNHNKGTTYSILIPIGSDQILSGKVEDINLDYDLLRFVGSKFEIADPLEGFDWDKDRNDKDKQIQSLKDKFQKISIANNTLITCYIDRSENVIIERLVKAALWYIFEKAKGSGENEEPYRLALCGYSDFQFLEIVRLIALYYNKNGDCPHMNKVEIYLHGKNVGSEIVISGDNINTVLSRMIRFTAACGVSPKYINSLQKLLTRKER